MARREQGSHSMVQLQPHLRVGGRFMAASAAEQGTAGWGSESLGLEPPPCTLGVLCGPPASEHPPHCLQKSLCPALPTPPSPIKGHRLSCSQMAWSWASAAGLELRRRRCVRGRRWGAVGGALGVSRLELPAVRALSSGPGCPVGGWKSALAWVGSRDRGSARMWCLRPYARGIQERRQPGLERVTLRRRGMA